MGFLCLHPAGASRRNACVGRAANTTPARGIRPPAVCGFEPPDIPSPLVAVLGLFQEGVAMSTAPSMPASVPVDLLPASAHRLRWDMGDVLRRLDASTAIEQARDHAVHLLRLQLGVLPYNSRRLSARRAVPLQQYVAATITRHHPEAP
ncbi:hypothetical protein I4I65_15815 [Xanthomonas campestris pv. campestris]|nr:hypothetical protein [Xanthomonas campestris pv. campestris]WDJ45554.1 hypothetical protein JH286_11405 [Xanthomonas campestris pv. campestris]WDJ53565.1 hypothetical protein JH293_10580 [Xanthomonas campestris pv. campestris]WDJ61974.1 hypothetical protein JH257_10605 [Xanthomonas campestris pv. campestris]WDJ66179.1 hypothetical protein JH266_10605 [Xanthomonas campestris pv. campestris]